MSAISSTICLVELDDFAKLRSFAYHTTHMENLERVRAVRRLDSTQSLCEQATKPHNVVLRARRTGAVEVQVAGHVVRVRDQSPLYKGNIDFEAGWDLARLCERLNQLVFFWPGNSKGPIDYGRRHASRYSGEPLAFLRVPTIKLFAVNHPSLPLFCRFNSGSPRHSGGKPSRRGAATFLPADSFKGGCADVVEVVFDNEAKLPDETQWAESLAGPWKPLSQK